MGASASVCATEAVSTASSFGLDRVLEFFPFPFLFEDVDVEVGGGCWASLDALALAVEAMEDVRRWDEDGGGAGCWNSSVAEDSSFERLFELRMESLLLDDEAAERVEWASGGAETGGWRSGECWEDAEDFVSEAESIAGRRRAEREETMANGERRMWREGKASERNAEG